VLWILAVLSCVCAWQRGAVTVITGDAGLGLLSANLWIHDRLFSALLNLGLTAVIALLVVYVNRAFNVLRSLTWLVATMFIAMQASVPMALGQFYGGTMLALIVAVVCALMFSIYDDPLPQRRVFLVFLLFSLAAFTQVGYLFYFPVLLAGMMQMRVFSLKTFLAALLGVMTPPWILFGFGIVDPLSLHFPSFSFDLPTIPALRELAPTLAAVVFTMVVGIIFLVANLLKILSYNARTRAYNGFLTMMLIFTIVAMFLHFSNFAFYLPLLNSLVAYQVGHFFTYRRHNRSYIAIMLLLGCYAGLYVWAVV